MPIDCALDCSPRFHQPPVVQCRCDPVNDHTVDVQSLASLDTSVTSCIPILNDFVQGSTCLSVRVVVAHMPKARLPPVVQSPSTVFNDPIVGPIGIGSLNARVSGCSPLIVRSRPRIALESGHA